MSGIAAKSIIHPRSTRIIVANCRTTSGGKGEYGSGIRTLIPVLKAECNMSEKRILGFFCNFGIQVSATYLSQQWTGGYALFHQEKSDLYRNGIAHSDYIQIDDTSARVNGLNQYCQGVLAPCSQPTPQPRERSPDCIERIDRFCARAISV
jgi:hypothetical protein